jgi:hypothetical protein
MQGHISIKKAQIQGIIHFSNEFPLCFIKKANVLKYYQKLLQRLQMVMVSYTGQTKRRL